MTLGHLPEGLEEPLGKPLSCGGFSSSGTFTGSEDLCLSFAISSSKSMPLGSQGARSLQANPGPYRREDTLLIVQLGSYNVFMPPDKARLNMIFKEDTILAFSSKFGSTCYIFQCSW